LLHTAISERFRGAARGEALYKSTFTLLYLLYEQRDGQTDVVSKTVLHGKNSTVKLKASD